MKLVLQRNRLYVESPDQAILERLLEHPDIAKAHEEAGGGGIRAGAGRKDLAASTMARDLVSIDLKKAAKDGEAAAAAADGSGDTGPGIAPLLPSAGRDSRDGNDFVEPTHPQDRERAERAQLTRELAAAEEAAAGAEAGMEAAAQSVTHAQKTGQRVDVVQRAAVGAGDEIRAVGGSGHAEASAIGHASDDVEIYSFEISASHVRTLFMLCRAP